MAPPKHVGGSSSKAGTESVQASGGDSLETRERLQSNQNISGPKANNQHDRGQWLKALLWHGGSAVDAWTIAASFQISQVLLTLPYSFAQIGTTSGVLLQIFYGFVGCWTCYLIVALYDEYRSSKEKEGFSSENHVIQWFEILDGLLGPSWKIVGLFFNFVLLFFAGIIQIIACASNVYLLNDDLDKRTWAIIFGASCFISILLPTFHNFRAWSFLSLVMITYVAWYVTIQSVLVQNSRGGGSPDVVHSGPTNTVLYFTGATNILFTFGGHSFTVELMHAMYKPSKFSLVYVLAILYVFTMTIPSAVTAYRAFGDELLTASNVLALFPRTRWRDMAVVLMLLHLFGQFICAILPLFFVWEKLLGVHRKKNIFFKAICRVPLVLSIWFFSIMLPFFGPINSAVGALLVTFAVYIIPCLAHMMVYRSAPARRSSVVKPPFFLMRSWAAVYTLNLFIVLWVLVVGCGLGGWASVKNLIDQIHTFGLFAKCYQCPKTRRS